MTLNNNSVDAQLSEIEHLTWLPWIGSDYFNNTIDERILILGESHYDANPATYRQTMNNRLFTRAILSEYGIGDDSKGTPFFNNIQKAFQGADGTKPSKFWKNVAFYNFVQKAMEQIKHRPTSGDFYKAWKVFPQIIEVLKPSVCVFIGVSASYQLGNMLENEDYRSVEWTWGEKIGRSKGRHTTVMNRNGEQTKLIFIRHTSAFFTSEKWHQFLAPLLQMEELSGKYL